jgi:serine/arginine repetitive matrix protein 2
MYNGIGLTTPRGSGTNGHVARNLSQTSNNRNRNHFKTPINEEQALKKSLTLKSANDHILEHEQKRRIEAELFEIRIQLEEDKKLNEEEIEDYIQREREKRMSTLGKKQNSSHVTVTNTSSTHEIAKAQSEKNDRLKSALRIRPEFQKDDALAFDDQKRKQMRDEYKKKKRGHSSSSSSDSSSESESDISKSSSKKSSRRKKRRRSYSSSSSSDSSSDSSDDESRRRHK